MGQNFAENFYVSKVAEFNASNDNSMPEGHSMEMGHVILNKSFSHNDSTPSSLEQFFSFHESKAEEQDISFVVAGGKSFTRQNFNRLAKIMEHSGYGQVIDPDHKSILLRDSNQETVNFFMKTWLETIGELNAD